MSAFLDSRPVSPFQIATVALCGLVLLLDGFDTQSIGFLAPAIAEELGIPVSSFGTVFAAGLFGLMVGTMVTGPIADRYGRKWAIILSTLTFGAFSLATPLAGTLNGFVAFRFLAGLGLGGAMPNVVALASEYAPRRLQPILVTLIFVGMGAGALLSGVLSSWMVPAWGWQSVFYVGGIAPIALSLVLVKVLPESIRFLAAHGRSPDEIRRILRRIAPGSPPMDVDVAPAAGERLPRIPVGHLFAHGRATATLLIWVVFFMNLLILYFILSWLPALLRQAGMPISAGITAVSVFSLGGITGVLAQGPLMKLCGSHRVVLGEFLLALVLIVLAGNVFESFRLTMIVTFTLGVCIQGAQAALNAMAAMYYPTTIRSTGVGWALGIGRVGSIVGPMIGGVMLSRNWPPQQILAAGAVPAACAVIAVLASLLIHGTGSPYRGERPVEAESVH